MNRSACAVLACSLIVVASATRSAAASRQTDQRTLTPATIVMQFPTALGVMERPAVEFNHAAHTTALSSEGCQTCHPLDDQKLTPKLNSTVDVGDRDGLIDCADPDCGLDGACTGAQCTAANEPCSSNSECCSGNCRTNGKKANTCS